MGHGRRQSQLYYLPSQQAQGPVVVSLGSWTARQGYQVGLPSLVQLLGQPWSWTFLQSPLQSLFRPASLGPEYRTHRDIQCICHLWRTPSCISFQQNACAGHLTSWTPATSAQLQKVFPFWLSQLHPVLFLSHHYPPSSHSAFPSEEDTCITQIVK